LHIIIIIFVITVGNHEYYYKYAIKLN